ncbi:ATP-dependent DNA helicase RecQ-like [Chironomus tepperi]|uniref:ATP-dependent DNA helicase RecQ-like n=1 Tax=Chironomus tepperi TaxID=113505 RepID=UPI00391FB497
MEVVHEFHEHPNEDHLKVLRDYFHIDNFKEDQWKAISEIMYKRNDVFICANSGYGKSLIYQYPAVFLGKKAIIVSPLISLMETQVQKLESLGIPACFVSGLQKNARNNVKNYTVIYTTPENFGYIRGLFKSSMDSDDICLFAVDEVQCTSNSSAEHRLSYTHLRTLKESFPLIPVVALTSTATIDATASICSHLCLRCPLILRVPLDLPNIEYTCTPQSHSFISDVKRFILDLPSDSGVIIYCFKRADTENYSEILTREGFTSRPYHAGLVEEIRSETLRDFMSGRLNFIVATNAFGMGVDRSNVRVVIHYGIPKNPETYYVESGRAGRDGEPAKSVIFWSDKDFKFHNYCFKENYRKGMYTNRSFNSAQILLAKMQAYTTTTNCRRASLLSYLEEYIPSVVHESCCDNCLKTLQTKVGLSKLYKEINVDGKIDVTDDVRVVLKLINSYQGKCKLEMLVDFITGTMPTEFDPKHPVEFFSYGVNKSKKWWNSILKISKEKRFVDKYTVMRNAENFIELWGGTDRQDYSRITPKGAKFMRLKTKKLLWEPTSVHLQSLTKSDTEYFIVDGDVHERPRYKVSIDVINANDKVFDFSAFKSHLNKNSPRKRLASESDKSDVSLTETFKSPLKVELASPATLERSPKLQRISESGDGQPCCSHWKKNVDQETMDMNGDKKQMEGHRCEEPENIDINNLNNIEIKTCKIVVPMIRMRGSNDNPTSPKSDNSCAKSDKSDN